MNGPWIGRSLWYRKQTVEVITEPDSGGRVCIKMPDERLKIVDTFLLEPAPSASFRCWWQGNKNRNFVIRKTDIEGAVAAMITIPESLLPEIMAMMKDNKTARESELWAKDHPANALDKVDEVNNDKKRATK